LSRPPRYFHFGQEIIPPKISPRDREYLKRIVAPCFPPLGCKKNFKEWDGDCQEINPWLVVKANPPRSPFTKGEESTILPSLDGGLEKGDPEQAPGPALGTGEW